MALNHDEAVIPRETDELIEFHYGVANAYADGLQGVAETLTQTAGKEAADAAMRHLFLNSVPKDCRPELDAKISKEGWGEALEQSRQENMPIDLIQHTQPWVDAACYAGQGLLPGSTCNQPTSIQEREDMVKSLIKNADVLRRSSSRMVGRKFDFIFEGVAARAGIDFGGMVSVEGVRLLSGLPITSFRNAISNHDLNPDEEGKVSAEEALAWLERRRQFYPSRWRNPADDQKILNRQAAALPDEDDMIRVPQAAEGDTFTPDRVVRRARDGVRLSITIGAKGEERHFDDFYQALQALASVDVARWRRRNDVGNWGIVRARGTWIAVRKAEIDRQLAEKGGEP